MVYASRPAACETDILVSGAWVRAVAIGRILKSSFHVSRLILHPALPIAPELIHHKTKLTSDGELVVLGNSITLTPGTITVEVAPGELVVHTIDKSSCKDLVNGLYDSKVSRLFSSKGGPIMTTFFFFVLITLTVLMLVYFYRVVRGPSVFDRVLGLNGISTKAIVLLVVIGTLFERVDMFIDISTGYALLNLVGALAIAKFLEERGASEK